ncbi:MAG: glycosyltransferase family 2 protein [Nitrososphaeria archaeon]
MKIINILYFSLPFLISFMITLFTFANVYLIWFTYFLWLSIFVGFFNFLTFFIMFLRARRYETSLVGKYQNLRVAAFVTSYNEDPEIVKGTLRSVKVALRGRGGVFLLDDSTDEKIVKELSEFCKNNGIYYFHRSTRRGFKAGAINDALKQIDDKYDLVAIFDADQRPNEDFFDEVIPYFNDEKIAFVQVPQKYTELRTKVAEGSRYQQNPFLYLIMQGRDYVSAFSLGSGTVYRISALKEAGYIDESSITEDVSTSISIHELGYKSRYVNKPLIWYGEPPTDINAYFIQQSRWSFGSFQVIKKILKSNLSFSAFVDYLSGWFYWLEAGPLTLFQLLAPPIFILLDIPIVRINPALYALIYLPFVVFSFSFYGLVMRGKEYGLKGFLYHQFLEYMVFFPVTLSFLAWLFRKKVPFRVTPKGKTVKYSRQLIAHIFFLILLYLTLIKGIIATYFTGNILLKDALIINVAWATFHAAFLTGGFYFALKSNASKAMPRSFLTAAT